MSKFNRRALLRGALGEQQLPAVAGRLTGEPPKFTEAPTASVLVRLRLFAEDGVRDYRGERFEDVVSRADLAAEVPSSPATGGPRLVRDGADITPTTEPDPHLTIDRVIRVDLAAGVRGVVSLVLHGACFGTMADLAGGRTCVDKERAREPVVTMRLEGEVDAPLPPHVEPVFGAQVPCSATPRVESVASGGSVHDDEICVPGGAFVLGSTIRSGAGYEEHAALPSTPRRIAVMPPLLVDRHEITVGHFRAAVARGFVSPDISPVPSDAPMATSSRAPEGMATWSTAPLGREEYPLIGISWPAARAFCQFEGGDLLTEAAWEYVASSAGRTSKTAFPWGNTPPQCEGVVFGRWDTKTEFSTECLGSARFGPAPVTAYTGDVTPLGVVGMGGGVAEWVLDSARSFSSVCWQRARLTDPRCTDDTSGSRIVRGGSWPERSDSANTGVREEFSLTVGEDPVARFGNVGFRCARPGVPFR